MEVRRRGNLTFGPVKLLGFGLEGQWGNRGTYIASLIFQIRVAALLVYFVTDFVDYGFETKPHGAKM